MIIVIFLPSSFVIFFIFKNFLTKFKPVGISFCNFNKFTVNAISEGLSNIGVADNNTILIFLGASFAETNRTPFDLPEAEQELAGGYNVEYSAIKFAMFFMGEYANMILASAVIVTLFFGGWTLPIFGLDKPAQTLLAGIAHICIFLSKLCFFLLVFIWTRWMFPRFRYDQLMRLSWKAFVPLALANIAITAIFAIPFVLTLHSEDEEYVEFEDFVNEEGQEEENKEENQQ